MLQWVLSIQHARPVSLAGQAHPVGGQTLRVLLGPPTTGSALALLGHDGLAHCMLRLVRHLPVTY